MTRTTLVLLAALAAARADAQTVESRTAASFERLGLLAPLCWPRPCSAPPAPAAA